MNPEQAAFTSIAPQSGSPIRFCIRQAVLGNTRSGVVVPITSRSISAGSTSAASRALRHAASASVAVVSSPSTIRRSRIPVRSRIHWSLVSIICSRS